MLSLKKQKGLKEAYEITMLCMPPPTNNLLTNVYIIYEIQQGGHTIESDLNATFFNPVVSNIPRWWMLKLLTWIQNLNHSTCGHKILYGDRPSKDEHLSL
jgi:hypothetical protein